MSTNAPMIEYWNADAGPAWVSAQERMDRFLEPFGARALEALELRGGERILDVGCGCGSTALALARAAGESGRVTGLDVSRPMLARAAERARRDGLDKRIELREADAQIAPLEAGAFDRVFSRFGVMFFDAPVPAFANLLQATRPGGRLGFVCWQTREKNLWQGVPARAVAAHVELPPEVRDDQPGPFGLASAERTRGILRDAGWREVELRPLEDPVLLGATAEDALALLTTAGPVGAVLRRADLGAALRARVVDAVRGAIEGFSGAGGIRAPAAAWVVRAQR